MDLVPYYECYPRVKFFRNNAPPPPPGFEEDRLRVCFRLTFVNSSLVQFDARPKIIPQRRFFAEGAEIARSILVSSGWAGEWTNEFVVRFTEQLSDLAPEAAADPRSRSDRLIMCFVLVVFGGMFPRQVVERWAAEDAVMESEETAAAEAAVRIFPADKAAVRALKEVEIIGRDEDDVCSVCLDELSIYGKGLEMPCSHVFHTHCLLKCLEFNHVSPLCRYALPIQSFH